MRKAVLGSIAAITAGAGFASAQGPRMPSSVMPAPVSVAPGGGVMPASMEMGMQMPPDAQPMAGPGMGGPGGPGMMPPGPFPGDMGMGMGPGPGGPGPVAGTGGSLAPKLEFTGKYLLYFVKGQPSPGPLATTSAPASFGILGQPTTQVLSGNGDFGMGLFSGFDLSGVLWRDPDRRIGVQFGGMRLETKNNGFSEFSDGTGSPLLARPFFNVQTAAQDTILASFPNAFSGGISTTATTNLWGGEANVLWNLYRSLPDDPYHVTVNWINGFRYYELKEQISVNSVSTAINGSNFFFNQQVFTDPATVAIRDRFQTLNQFYGGQVGLAMDVKYGRVFGNAYGKLGLGINHQQYLAVGSSSISDPNTGANTTVRSGVLANPSNMGRFSDDQFMLVPEAGFSLGYNWTSWFTTTVGYSFLYMDNVLRPGDQFTTAANSTQIPVHPAYGGAALPVPNPALNRTDFWAQGVTFGFVFRW